MLERLRELRSTKRYAPLALISAAIMFTFSLRNDPLVDRFFTTILDLPLWLASRFS